MKALKVTVLFYGLQFVTKFFPKLIVISINSSFPKARLNQWRHQPLKYGGQLKGQVAIGRGEGAGTTWGQPVLYRGPSSMLIPNPGLPEMTELISVPGDHQESHQ